MLAQLGRTTVALVLWVATGWIYFANRTSIEINKATERTNRQRNFDPASKGEHQNSSLWLIVKVVKCGFTLTGSRNARRCAETDN
jgi:hypothetical protein